VSPQLLSRQLPPAMAPGAWPAVCFDLDGTLLVSGDGSTLRVAQALRLASAGRSCAAWVLDAADSAAPAAAGSSAALEPLIGDWPPDRRELARANYAALDREGRRARGLSSVPGAAYLLRRLAEHGYRSFVVTNASQASADRALAWLGLDQWITAIHGIDPQRPTDKGLRLRRLALELAPQETLMLGDSAGDLAAAHQAGLPALHFTGSGATPEEGAGADSSLDALPDLEERLAMRTRQIEALRGLLPMGPLALAVGAPREEATWAQRLAAWLRQPLAPWGSAPLRVWCGPRPSAWPGGLPAHLRLGVESPLEPALERL
jgi:phosphoglycolate phosphatase